MNGKKGTALRKGFLFLILFLVSSSAVLFPRPISITVMEKKGTTKQVLLIGVTHSKDLDANWRTGEVDYWDYKDYFNNIRDLIALKKTWPKQVDFLAEAPPAVRNSSFFEDQLLKRYGENLSPACPFHFIQIDRRPDWLGNLCTYVYCKNQVGSKPLSKKFLRTFAKADCGTIGEFRTYLRNVYKRIDTIHRSLPDWLKLERDIESLRLHKPSRTSSHRRMFYSRRDNFNRLILAFSASYIDIDSHGQALLPQLKEINGEQTMKRHFKEMDRNDQQNTTVDQRMQILFRIKPNEKEHSSRTVWLLYEKLTNVLFLYEIANSQKNKDQTILMCGNSHKATIIEGLEARGYTKTRERREVKTRIPAIELREWITGFCGLCDECGKTSNQVCPTCKYVRYCGREHQQSGWGSNKKKIYKHNRCCEKMKKPDPGKES